MTAAGPVYQRLQVTLADITSLDHIDFSAFQADHPNLTGTGPDLICRLATALEPTFASAPPPPDHVTEDELQHNP